MNSDFAVLAGALVAVYGGMKAIMDTVYVINGKRDLIIDFDGNGQQLDRSRRCNLLYTDVIPLIIGLSLFLTVYAAAFLLLGVAILSGQINDVGDYVAYFLFASGGASLYALWIVITKNIRSIGIMRKYVIEKPDTSALHPVRCCKGECRLSPHPNKTSGDQPPTSA